MRWFIQVCSCVDEWQCLSTSETLNSRAIRHKFLRCGRVPGTVGSYFNMIDFRAVLGSQQNGGKGAGSSPIPLSLCTGTVPHQTGTSVTIEEPPVTPHRYHPKSILYKFTLRGIHSLCFVKCVMT